MTFTPLRLLPDAEAVARDVLAASGVPVSANTPSDLDARLPWITCRRVGGASIHPRFLDRATFTVDCWSANRPTSIAIAETCRVLLFTAWQTQAVHSGASVSRFTEIVAPVEFPTDGAGDLVRVSATYSLLVRPSR